MTSGLPEEGQGEGGAELSPGLGDRTGSQLHEGRIRPEIRKLFFAERVVRHWNRLLCKWPMPHACQCFKRHLEYALNNMP